MLRPHIIDREYPLQRSFVRWGLAAAFIGSALFLSPLAGIGFLIVFAVAGAVWRPGEPALAYALSYQSLFILIGYLYFCTTGVFPVDGIVGSVEWAVSLSLIGLIALAVGLRFGIASVPKPVFPEESHAWTAPYDVRRLFWLTVAVGSISWLIEIAPTLIWFDGAQIIHRLLQFRTVLFFLLVLTVLRRQQGYPYVGIALVVYLVPSFSSHMSAFSEVFLVVFAALVSEWRPWERRTWERWRSKRVVRHAIAIAGLLVILALVWTGGVKGVWRSRVLSGEVTGSVVGKAWEFMTTVAETAPGIQLDKAGYQLSARMSSSLGYFADTLKRVPAVVPHENGKMTERAIKHVLMPRILFPDKGDLGSDSWLVQKYAGRAAAGMESRTSIGLGYMAQFYIDFGIPGMFIALSAFGAFIGVLYCSAASFCPSYDLYRAFVFGLASHFCTYGAELAKLTGAILLMYLVLGALLFVVRRPLHRLLSSPRSEGGRRSPASDRLPALRRPAIDA